jgi:septum site-determining protein MinD
MQFSFNFHVKFKRKIPKTGIVSRATGRNQFLNHLRAKNNLPFNKQNSFKTTTQKWLGLNDFYSCKTKTKSWAICSELTENTDNYSTLEPLVPNIQTNLQQSLDSEPKESRVIVVTSGKGGVGKTTATANIGMSIARLGYKVVVIDADIGLKNLDLLLGLENRILYTVMDVFEGQCRLDQALIRDKRWKNLSLLSISKNRQRYNVTRKNMQNLVSALTNLNFQYIFIDCPAGIDVGFINAISPAKEALIVTTSELPAMRDADRVAGLLEANGIFQMKLLVNRVRSDMIQKNDMMSVRDVQEALGVPLLGAIPEDSEIIISTNRGEPLVLKKKLSLSGIAFENAARRLVGKQDYFVDLNAPYKGLFAQFVHSIKNF